jgi:ATP-binding cassette subfamily B protein
MLLVVLLLFCQAMCELSLPAYMSDIINNGIVPMDMPYIYKTGLIMVGLAFACSLFAVGGGFFASRTAAGASRDIRRALFSNVTDFSSAELDSFSTASLITRATNDVQQIQQAAVMTLRMAIFAPIMGIGALVRALATSPSLTWTIGLALAVIICIMVFMFFAVMPKFRILQSKLDRLNQVIAERLSGLLVVRAFNSEQAEEERFDVTNTELRKINIFVNRCMAFLFPSMTIVMNLVNILIVWVGAHMVESQNLLIGDMLAFLQYAMHVIISFLFVTMMFIMIPRAAVSGNRIGEVLDIRPTIRDAEDAVTPSALRGEITFRDVSFAYPDAEEKTLDDISFTAAPGTTTAIIGGTGSGKSSLISLIPRLFDVTEGAICLDGQDIRTMPQKSLRDAIGYVPQKGLLFTGTIADNLRYGKSDATMEELERAAATAQSLSFIKEMPNGFDTEVAQGGTSVSGGQKQRLSIARALVKDPQVLIFDDSFSALDFKTDAALRKALKESASEKTLIIVAQRINTIMDADQILVMEDGRIVGRGTHEELLRTCELYKEIAMSQLSEEELGKGVA